ncbi:MAG: hypothetical protein HYX66_03555 [Ignavibacteria bacterium]|nr:hypothetical protein [Ignavibacteria bacterium]
MSKTVKCLLTCYTKKQGGFSKIIRTSLVENGTFFSITMIVQITQITPLTRAIVLGLVVFASGFQIASSQCDFVFYRDSLRQMLNGYNPNYITRVDNYAYLKEFVDSNSTKYIYRIDSRPPYDTTLAYRILKTGEVYSGSDTEYPLYRLCDSVGSQWITYKNGPNIDYMKFVGLSGIEVLGKFRLSRIYQEYVVFEAYPDSLFPTYQYYLVDSLGLVSRQEPDHPWANEFIQGIWFGSSFVGILPVGVQETEAHGTKAVVEVVDDHLYVRIDTEQHDISPSVIQLFNIRGQLIYSSDEFGVIPFFTDLKVNLSTKFMPILWVLRSGDSVIAKGITMSR